MSSRAIQLVLHYDGSEFAGWQRQPSHRTVQGVLEEGLQRLLGMQIPVIGAGRTDAGVHARGQAAGVSVPTRWNPAELRRALNAILPQDVWISGAYEMHPSFHPRYSAKARRYSYNVGTTDESRSPFRSRWEYALGHRLDYGALHSAARTVVGEHRFLAFAVRGTAPPEDTHICTVTDATWREMDNGAVFEIEANRFLHHMVRFLVGTMLDIATGRRPLDDMEALLVAETNNKTSPPAPPHALCLESVVYPEQLYHDGI